MSKIKVVHISTYASGGAGIAAYRIHEALIERNIESSFLCLDANGLQQLNSCIEYPKPTYNIVQRAIRKFIRLTDKYYCFGKLFPGKYYRLQLKKIKSKLHCDASSLPYSIVDILKHPVVNNADIIHLHWVAGMLDYPSFFKKNKKPVVWTMHDLNPVLGLFHYEEDELRNHEVSSKLNYEIIEVKREAIKNKNCNLIIVAPSHWLLDKVESSTVFNSIKKECIYYPLNTNIFKPKVTDGLRNKLKLSENKTVLLFVSQTVVHFRKGYDLLIDAINNMDSSDIALFIIGYSQGLAINNSTIIYLGTASDNEILSDYYSLADAVIISSREDNLPNVMLESLACGTPVLSFDVGGMAEIVQDGISGLKAKAINVEALKNVMEQFKLEKEKYDSKIIREYAVNNFSNKVVAEKYLEVYKSIL